MMLASSPYRKRGALFHRWRDYFGRDDTEVLGLARAKPRHE